MKIINFSKTFKNGVFRDFEILKFSSNKPPLVLVLRKTRGFVARNPTDTVFEDLGIGCRPIFEDATLGVQERSGLFQLRIPPFIRIPPLLVPNNKGIL